MWAHLDVLGPDFTIQMQSTVKGFRTLDRQRVFPDRLRVQAVNYPGTLGTARAGDVSRSRRPLPVLFPARRRQRFRSPGIPDQR
jgi:hypothetical protein